MSVWIGCHRICNFVQKAPKLVVAENYWMGPSKLDLPIQNIDFLCFFLPKKFALVHPTKSGIFQMNLPLTSTCVYPISIEQLSNASHFYKAYQMTLMITWLPR